MSTDLSYMGVLACFIEINPGEASTLLSDVQPRSAPALELVVLPRPGEPRISRAASSVGSHVPRQQSQHREQSQRRADTKKNVFLAPL